MMDSSALTRMGTFGHALQQTGTMLHNFDWLDPANNMNPSKGTF